MPLKDESLLEVNVSGNRSQIVISITKDLIFDNRYDTITFSLSEADEADLEFLSSKHEEIDKNEVNN